MSGSSGCDVAIIIALEAEFNEFLRILPGEYEPVRKPVHGGYDYCFEVHGYRCVVTMIGVMGTEQVGILSKFLARWRPLVAVTVGVAASLREEFQPGDVIVAAQVDAFSSSKSVALGQPETSIDIESEYTRESFYTDHRLVEDIRHLRYAHSHIFERWQVEGGAELASEIPDNALATLTSKGLMRASPTLVTGNLASGVEVGVAELLLARGHRPMIAIDLETAMLPQAVVRGLPSTRTLVIRGVFDFSRKRGMVAVAGLGIQLRRVAMRNATRLLFSLMEAKLLPSMSDPDGQRQRSAEHVAEEVPSHDPTSTAFWVERLVIHNLRCIETLSLDISALAYDGRGQWLVFLGKNGRGKTTLLRGIALALLPHDTGSRFLYDLSAEAPMVRSAETTANVEIRTAHAGNFVSVVFAGDSRESLQLQRLVLEPPLVLGYGCRRGSALGGPKRQSKPDPLEGCATLFDESAHLIHADTWLRDIHAIRDSEPDFYHAVLDTLKRVLDVQAIEIRPDRTWIEASGIGRVPLAALSDGYLTTLGWVIDMIARWAQYARRRGVLPGEAFNEAMPCVVLIDEIDLHLHPAWQVEMVERLRRAFPMTTFIATTHNPATLMGLQAHEIIRLGLDEQGRVTAQDVAVRAPGLLTGSELYDEYFGIRQATYAADLQRYGLLAGNPARTDDEEREVRHLLERFRAVDIDPGWEPVPRHPGDGS